MIDKSFVLTGAPGAGKTSIISALGWLGFTTVAEAATDVIATAQAAGLAEPWRAPDFLEAVVLLQRQRQRAAVATRGLQFHDRSAICTLALARFLQRPIPFVLTEELARIAQERAFAPHVFVIGGLGFITPTAARRISLQEARDFERLHIAAYREYGYTLIEIPPASVAARVRQILEIARRT